MMRDMELQTLISKLNLIKHIEQLCVALEGRTKAPISFYEGLALVLAAGHTFRDKIDIVSPRAKAA